MTTLIFSNGILTPRKPKQSIKSHIAENKKQWWIFEYMRISGCEYEIALKSYMEVFKND